jgi:GNAT superfamily N-acetyltransferase
MPAPRPDRGALTGSGRLRPARREDVAAIEELIRRSARALCAGDYSAEQIDGALRGAFGVDTQLIDDGTYFVVEEGGRLVACGGWSFRGTLFGGDAKEGRDRSRLDPRRDAAKIRAFFVDPEQARKGLGRRLLEHCEAAARAEGFTRFELMATRAGARLYRRFGYVEGEALDHDLGGGLTIDFVPMTKDSRPAASA